MSDNHKTYFGPTRRAFESLDPDGQEDFARYLTGLVRRFDRSCDQTIVAPGEYLEGVPTRR